MKDLTVQNGWIPQTLSLPLPKSLIQLQHKGIMDGKEDRGNLDTAFHFPQFLPSFVFLFVIFRLSFHFLVTSCCLEQYFYKRHSLTCTEVIALNVLINNRISGSPTVSVGQGIRHLNRSVISPLITESAPNNPMALHDFFSMQQPFTSAEVCL